MAHFSIQTSSSVIHSILIIAINVLPLLLLGLTWWRYRKEGTSLSGGRQKMFVSAFVVIAVSAGVLLSFVVHGWVIASGRVELDRAYPVLSMVAAALVGAVLAGFGRRASRFLLIVDGMVVALLWYFAALAASP